MEHDDWDEPPRIYFSPREVFDLVLASLVLTAAMALILGGRKGDILELSFGFDWGTFVALLPFSALATIPAFILHELAHKIVAQKKDLFAEFQANFIGLGAGIALTFLFKLLFAVPGVVQIMGRASRRDEGIISIVGPLVNIVIAYSAFFLDGLFPGVRLPGSQENGIGNTVFEMIMILNLILAGFNMLPFGPLDGRKVWRWSWMGFVGVWALLLALVLLYSNV